MQIIMQILTDSGWIDFARFWDMPACTTILAALADYAGIAGRCLTGQSV